MAKQWFQEKEHVRTNKPILFTLWLIKVFPIRVVNAIAYCVAGFYYIFAKNVRQSARAFQKHLRKYTNGKSPKRVSAYKAIQYFSLCIVERIAGWVGKTKSSDLIFNDDDIQDFWNNLSAGRGCVLVGSHMGNIDLLRSLSSYTEAGLKKDIPVTAVMEMDTSKIFTDTLEEINPKFNLNIVDPRDINPGTIAELDDRVQNGGIVVITGDRIPANNPGRCLSFPFLGQDATFPYGTFLVCSLLRAPIYFVFNFRQNLSVARAKNIVYMKKAKTEFEDGETRQEREELIRSITKEFVGQLENYCVQYPYQWYNFFDFWAQGEGSVQLAASGQQ